MAWPHKGKGGMTWLVGGGGERGMAQPQLVPVQWAGRGEEQDVTLIQIFGGKGGHDPAS